jgi:hypothetical protein
MAHEELPQISITPTDDYDRGTVTHADDPMRAARPGGPHSQEHALVVSDGCRARLRAMYTLVEARRSSGRVTFIVSKMGSVAAASKAFKATLPGSVAGTGDGPLVDTHLIA